MRAIACASTGDTSASLAAYGAAAGLPVAVLLPRGKVSTAQLVQPHRQRRAGARARHRLRRLHGDRAAARRREARLPRQLDERAPHRGAEDGRRSRSCSSSTGRCPTGSCSRAATSATPARSTPGFRMMKELGIIDRYPRLAVAQAASANPLYRAWSAGQERGRPRSRRSRRSRPRSRSATR